MPVNLNPPPLPTPESARSVQSVQPVDDAQSSDVFAQLVAAASVAKAPSSIVAADGRAREEKTRDADGVRADASQSDLIAALAALPVAAPLAAPVESPRERAADDTNGRAPPPRIARAMRPEADAVQRADATAPGANAATAADAQRAAGSAALREQLAAALSPRATTTPSTAPKPASANDREPRDVRNDMAATNVTATPAPLPFAAALAASVARERAPSAVTHDNASALDAAAAVTTPLSTSAPSAPAAPATGAIDTPVGAPGFGDELAAKLAHVVIRHDRVELRLSPAELGPVDIRIDMRNESASLTIVAVQPATREALEQALPQLRDSLAAQGIALGQAAINDGRAQSERDPGMADVSSPRAASRDDVAAPVIAARTLRLSDRLIDTFA